MSKNKKVLLVLLPFWDPLIPPLGLACLKSYLEPCGIRVKTVDANVESRFRQVYDRYFGVLEASLPIERRGHIYNVGMEMLQNHMMAHLNREQGKDNYTRLVKTLFYETFYWEIPGQHLPELEQIAAGYYRELEMYLDELLAAESPEVLGLSVYGGTLPASVYAFRWTRQAYPHIKLIMGGGIFSEQLAPGSPNLQTFLEKTKNYIDHFFIGEGEILLWKYLSGQLDETRRVYTLEDIRSQAVELAAVREPDFTDFQLEHYPHLAAYSSRSCPYQCSFCSEAIQWGKFRKKEAGQVVKELMTLYKQYGTQLFLMGDSLMNPIIRDLARAFVESGTALYWDGYLRIDGQSCDRDNVFLWRRGGFYRARLGVESGSQKLLEAMGKRINPDQVKTAVSTLAEAGIKTTTMWIIGHPGETEEDFLQTLDLIETLKDDIYQADCNVFRYFLTGQTHSHHWSRSSKPVYPEWAGDLLMVQTWLVDVPPSREEVISRLNRFMAHCRQLGIPNPYTLKDIHSADQRWQKLHENSVPPVVQLYDSTVYIDECKSVEKPDFAQDTIRDEGDFCL